MGKIYDKNGKKMNISEICEEIISTMTNEEVDMLYSNIEAHDDEVNDVNDAHGHIAHAILDSYKYIDSTSERGQRLRRLLDNIMTKYQKSTKTSDEDESSYKNLIRSIKESKME